MIWIILFQLTLNTVSGDEHTHEYAVGEQVVLWMNTAGPYNNLQETYPYFSLPFCKGPLKKIEHHHETMAEALQGIELEFSGLDIRFKQPTPPTNYCTKSITSRDYTELKEAVEKQYWYQMYLDDLPVLAVVGEVKGTDKNTFLWTKKKFEILYNRNKIVGVTLTTSEAVKIKPDILISFSYEVEWKESDLSFESRFDHYLDLNFFQHRIHWFSICNSFMIAVFLIALVSMILMRTLRKDYARYNKEDGLEALEKELGDEYGWKQVHGDVFRPPTASIYLASLIGTGVHIVVVSVVVTVLAFLGKVYTERGGLLSTVIFVYAILSPVNGFFGGRVYSHMNGKLWIRQLVIGSLFLPLLISILAFGMNFLALVYQTSRSVPFLTMLSVFAIIVFVVLPLNLIGTVIGRNVGSMPSFPCRINAVPRPIPKAKWFTRPHTLCLLGGVLPFGSIFIEMYFILTSFWAYKVYYVFGFTLLVICILISVTCCATIVCVYFLLNAEDYRWPWISFFSGASTSIYVYIYSIYYFFFKTKMFGLYQTAFYFGYMAFFCFTLGCMCGAVGYLAANRFVRKIYSTVKID